MWPWKNASTPAVLYCFFHTWHNSIWACKIDLSALLNSPEDHLNSAIMFQVLLVTHFCTCEIGWVGVDYPEWDFSEQSSRHCPGASPTHACLMAVICEWDRARSAHCASLMKTGRFSSDQAWNSQVVCPWHFSSVQIGMCGVMCMRERHREQVRERGENYAFPIPKCVLSKTSIGVW